MTDLPETPTDTKKSRLPIVVGVLVIVTAVLGFVVYRAVSSLDQIVESGIESYGPDILGAEVQLDGVTVNLSDGAAELRGLFIGNPEGFQTDHAMKVGRISVQLDLQSLTKTPVLVREVTIEAPDIVHDSAAGGSNLDRLSKNVEAYTGAEEESGDEATKMIIEHLYVRDGQVSVSHSVFKGKKVTSPLPDLHLRDIGKDSGGASPGEVAKAVFGRISASTSTVAGKAVDTFKSGTSKLVEAGKGAGAALKDGLSGAGEKLKGLFDEEKD